MKTIEERLDDEQVRLTKKISSWIESRPHFQTLIDESVLKKVDLDYTGNYLLYLSASGTSQNLVQIFRALMRNGFRLCDYSDRPTVNTPEWTGKFQKLMSSSGKHCHVLVCFQSTVCRFEQIGTETKEVPIYKVVCDDQPEPTSQPTG